MEDQSTSRIMGVKGLGWAQYCLYPTLNICKVMAWCLQALEGHAPPRPYFTLIGQDATAPPGFASSIMQLKVELLEPKAPNYRYDEKPL